jgi:hypothetical protein
VAVRELGLTDASDEETPGRIGAVSQQIARIRSLRHRRAFPGFPGRSPFMLRYRPWVKPHRIGTYGLVMMRTEQVSRIVRSFVNCVERLGLIGLGLSQCSWLYRGCRGLLGRPPLPQGRRCASTRRPLLRRRRR